MADWHRRVHRRRKEPAKFVGLDRFDELGRERRDRDGVRPRVLGLRPIDNPLLGIPLSGATESGSRKNSALLAGQRVEAIAALDVDRVGSVEGLGGATPAMPGFWPR